MQIKLMFLMITCVISEIHIWEPSSLRQIYKDKKLDYSIANFGSVPYGHSVYGTVFQASPLDACHDLKPLNWESNSGTLIIYAQRGNCHFAQKVLNAQKAGAGLVIIGDTNDEDVSKILPVERTTQLMNQIRIPSILIMKKDAEHFSNVLNSDQGALSLAIHFPLTKANDVASIKMILQVDDYRSYESVLALAQYKEPFENNMKLQIHYKIFKNIKNMFNPKNCIKNNDVFCIFTENKNSQNLLQETLKQICLFNQSWDTYIQYFRDVKQYCFDSLQQPHDEFTNCTEKIYDNNVTKDQKEKIQNCMNPNSQEAKKFLNENNDNIKYYLINYSPIVFINGYMYKGNYKDSTHLMESFCNSFEEVPLQCKNLSAFKQYYDFSSYSIFKFILLSILSTLFVTAVIVGIFYFFYRKRIKSSFKVELNDKINEALSKYYNDGQKDFNYNGVAKNNQF